MEKKPIIAFIGAGNMGTSLIGGLLADKYPADCIWATNPNEETLTALKKDFNINTTSSNGMAAQQADILVLAVKPFVLKSVIEELKDIIVAKKPLLISIVTGIKTESILTWLNDTTIPIVRAMPNTPCLVRSGVTGLYATSAVTHEQKQLAESILRSVSVIFWFQKESDLDVVTAISGSGPAYIFLIMEIMQQIGVELGLEPKTSELLTLQTTLGSARMALEIDEDVATLRKQVTSPGGTTEQALKAFEEGNLKKVFANALQAAHRRAVELSETIK